LDDGRNIDGAHPQPPLSLIFNGKQLLDDISHTKWLITLIETTGVIDNTLSLYKSRHRPATPKGEKPIDKEKSWHNYIDDANSLLNKVLTRSEKNSSVAPLSIKQAALQPKPISSKKRKLGEKDPQPTTIPGTGSYCFMCRLPLPSFISPSKSTISASSL
jgi:hypothetical protein